MKRIVDDTAPEGLEVLLGERVTFYMDDGFIYCGKLVGVNTLFVKLEDAGIVYETGPHDTKAWTDYQPFPHPRYLMVGKINSFGVFKQ